MFGTSGRALRMLAVCILALSVLAATGGSTGSAAHRAEQGAQPIITIPTSLAVDQSSGFVFVTAGDFSNQTAGATGPGRLLVLAMHGAATTVIRSVPVGSGPASMLVDARTGRVLIVNLGGGDQYAGYTGSSLSVLDLAALERGSQNPVVHTTPLPGQLAQQIAIDRVTGRTFVASWLLATAGQVGKGNVSVLNTQTGALLRTVALGTVAQALAVDEVAGRVFVLQSGSASGSLMAVLDARTGKVVQTFSAGRTVAPLGVDGRTGRLFIAAQGGVQVRSTRDGALLRTVSLGQTPATFIADEQHGHMFVVTAGTYGGNDVYTANGMLCMLDARTGTLLGRAAVGLNLPAVQFYTGVAPPTAVINRSGDRIFVANNSSVGTGGSQPERGTISVIQVSGKSLHLLHTTPLGAGRTIPTALGVDTATNTVFASTLTPTTADALTIGLAILDGQTGAITGTLPLPAIF